MKISIKRQTVLKRGQKKVNPLFKGQKKAKLVCGIVIPLSQ